MGLTKEQWMDAIEDAKDKVFSRIKPIGQAIETPAEEERVLREVKDYFIKRWTDYSYECWYPVTKGEIRRDCFLTRKKANWVIQKLLKEGWIEHDKYVGKTDVRFLFCRRGFRASEKLEKTEEYKKAWKEMCDVLYAVIRGEN